MLKNILSFFLLCILVIIIGLWYSGCASKGFPSGGPVDKTPPEIVMTFPVPDSTHISDLSEINIRFSEMMNESSVANSIFISPPVTFEAEWESYTELNITLQDSLRENQTYVLVLGAKISDIRNNKMSSSYQLAFSTGSDIDQGKISGRVYGLDRNQTLTLFAFELDSDTLRFDKNKPDYVSQTGDKGNYLLSYLKNGTYRVFGVDDQNHNLLIDSDLEEIAIPLNDVVLDSTSNSFSGLNFRLTKIDTLAPVLSNIRSRNSTRFDMRLSEKVVLSSVDQIAVIDSMNQTKINVLATSVNVESDNILEVYTSPMDSGRVYLCQVKALADSSGNMAVDTTMSFVAGRYVQPDTFKIVTFTPADSAWSIHPQSQVYFEVNNPLDKKSFTENFLLMSAGSDTISGRLTYPSAYEAQFKPMQALLLDTVYTIRLNLPEILNVWGDSLGDSVHVRHFKISNGDDYGEIAGTVSHPDLASYPVYVQAKRVGRKEAFDSWINEKDSYVIPFLPDASYQMNAYLDSDSSGSYSAGHLFPFNFSEPFIYMSDTVKVRKRWESSGVNIVFPGDKQK